MGKNDYIGIPLATPEFQKVFEICKYKKERVINSFLLEFVNIFISDGG